MSLLGAVRSSYVNVEVPLLATTVGDVFLGRWISYICIQRGKETLLFFCTLYRITIYINPMLPKIFEFQCEILTCAEISEKGVQSPNLDTFRQDQWFFQSFHWIFPIIWVLFFKTLRSIFLSQCGQSSHMDQAIINSVCMACIVIPLFLLTLFTGISLRDCQRMIPDEGKPAADRKGATLRSQSYQLGKEGNRAPGSPGQRVLTYVSGTKILFQQLYCHY